MHAVEKNLKLEQTLEVAQFKQTMNNNYKAKLAGMNTSAAALHGCIMQVHGLLLLGRSRTPHGAPSASRRLFGTLESSTCRCMRRQQGAEGHTNSKSAGSSTNITWPLCTRRTAAA